MPSKKRTRSSKNNNNSNNNNRSRNARYSPAKLSSKPTFAQKLAVFLLQGVKGQIQFSEQTGFTEKHTAVFGVLPFLHMNIQEKTFRRMLDNAEGSLADVLISRCNEKGLNKKLKAVEYNCNKQSLSGVKALNDGIMASIKDRYSIRQNGKKRASEMATFMTWQCKNGKIPSDSLKWCKPK